MSKLLLSIVMMAFVVGTSFAGSITGKVTNVDDGSPLIGANVYLEGTTIGSATDIDGYFEINAKDGEYTIICNYVGYAEKSSKINVAGDLEINFQLSENLFAKTITIMASRAKERETPVAFTNIDAEQLEVQLASRDIPMVLNTTPGVYATETGGGAGDARINIRGFDQRNVAVKINGVPVNDMENGWVYWSNWAGLGDVTSSIQVQRGLGSSTISVPSVGGTMDVVTNSAALSKFAKVKYEAGSDNLQKTTAIYSTGVMENNFSFSAMVARKTGDGYADKTYIDDFSYFFTVGTYFDDHTLNLTWVGAPQSHGQRTSKNSIREYKTRGERFNQNWGYLNGKVLMERENRYHKPVINLDHHWKLSSDMTLSTVGYASYGRGYGTGGISSSWGRTDDGQIDFDAVFQANLTNIDTSYSDSQTRATNGLRESVNNHNWFGLISSMDYQFNDEIRFNAGIDGRYYKGEHYRRVRNLLGADYYLSNHDINNPNRLTRNGDKIVYHNDGLVRQLGGFGLVEYKADALSLFANASGYQKEYQRVDYFQNLDSDPNQETDWIGFTGFTLKGGANYNLNESMNIYGNAGYYSNAPIFDTVFPSFTNQDNTDAENETVTAVELGVGLNFGSLAANINGFYTMWDEHSYRTTIFPLDYSISGISALHQGLEVDLSYRLTDNISIQSALTFASYEWTSNADVVSKDEDNVVVDEFIAYSDGLSVGDSPQTSAVVGLDLSFNTVGSNYVYLKPLYKYFADNFSNFSPDSRTDASDTKDSWQLPNHGLLDIHAGYVMKFEDTFFKTLRINLNIFNALDEEYITDADDNAVYNFGEDYAFQSPVVGNHTSEAALVYFGRRRTANIGISVEF